MRFRSFVFTACGLALLAPAPRVACADEPPKETLQFDGAALADRGFLAPTDYGGFPFNRNFLRGFTNESALRNGFRDYGYLAPSDFANIDAIEVLKGPASALYGNGKPGGDLNTVARRLDGAVASYAALSANHFGFTRGQVNLGGRLGEDSAAPAAYRVDAAIQGGPSFRDHVSGLRTFVAPGLAVALGPATHVTVEAEVFRRTSTWDPIFVPDRQLLTAPIEFFAGEPFNKEHTSGTTLRAAFVHGFGANLKLRQSLYVHRGRNDHLAANYDTFGLTAPVLVEPDGVTVNRIAERVLDTRDFRVSQTEVYFAHDLLGAPSTAFVGVEFGRFEYGFDMFLAPLAPIRIDAPVYGATPGAFDQIAGLSFGTSTTVLYLGNRTQVGERLKIYVGARVERFRTFLDDRLDVAGTASRTRTVTSPRIGATYAAAPTQTVFISATSSARPQIGAKGANDEIFPEERGEQLELGLQSRSGSIVSTLSLYRIRWRNVLAIDPVNPNFAVPAGRRQSDGIEWDVNGTLGPAQVNLSVAYTDARVTRDTSLPAGARLVGVARSFASLFVRWRLPAAGWTVGAGALYESAAQATLPASDVVLPAYKVFDASLTYQAPARWYARLGLANLFNERAYTSFGYAIRPVPPRTLQVSAGMDL